MRPNTPDLGKNGGFPDNPLGLRNYQGASQNSNAFVNHLMKTVLAGLVCETTAIGIAYFHFKALGRVTPYSAFYAWPIDLLIEPALLTLGLSVRGLLFVVAGAVLFLLNSLKWSALLLLHRIGYTKLAIALLIGLILLALASFSLKSVGV